MKIPRKKELLELQKKYRTDKKIGEVYGVPSRLVAYWRSKKKIGSYNLPKYSQEKISDLWNRYGEDNPAGKELGISGAGFRRWRMIYGIKNKPAQLKMEQLELDFADITRQKKTTRKETLIRKLLARKSGLKTVEIGETVTVEPDLAIAVDNISTAINQFNKTGKEKVFNPHKIAVILNRLVKSQSQSMADEHKIIRDFVRKQNIAKFYDIGWGISHQVVIDEGLLLPGQLAIGTDHHSATYGCLGAFSYSVSPREMMSVWASGKIKLEVPETIKVVITGQLARGVSVNDIILKLSRDINKYADENLVFEFYGLPVAAMTISQRTTLSNFAIDAGAKSAIVPFDDVTQKYLKKITKAKYKHVAADFDAEYRNVIEFDVSYLTPQVVSHSSFKEIIPVEEIHGKKINHVVIGGCTNGHLGDLEIAASILRGRRIYRNTRMIVIPASRKIFLKAMDKGYIRTLIESGCLVLNPSHCSCINANNCMLARGERALTTTCRSSFDGNDSNDSEIYIASPATASATALNGAITDPRKYLY